MNNWETVEEKKEGATSGSGANGVTTDCRRLAQIQEGEKVLPVGREAQRNKAEVDAHLHPPGSFKIRGGGEKLGTGKKGRLPWAKIVLLKQRERKQKRRKPCGGGREPLSLFCV